MTNRRLTQRPRPPQSRNHRLARFTPGFRRTRNRTQRLTHPAPRHFLSLRRRNRAELPDCVVERITELYGDKEGDESKVGFVPGYAVAEGDA